MNDVLTKLESFKPLKDFFFGHTPFQIEFFKTTSQNGDRKFEYWQHILQLKAIKKGLQEIDLDIAELEDEIEDASSWMPFWNKGKRARKLPRLKFKMDILKETKIEREREAERHLEVLERKYKDLFAMTEAELLSGEGSYWVTRLTRQLAAAHLGAKLGVNAGDMAAVMSMPQNLQTAVLKEIQASPDKLLKAGE